MELQVRYYVARDAAYFILPDQGETSSKDICATGWREAYASFPADLIRLLYLDYHTVEALVHHADRELRTLTEKKDPACIGRVKTDLQGLRELHPFFRITELEWLERIQQAEDGRFRNLTDLLPRKRLSQIPAELYLIQRQAKEIIYRVLDVDRKNGDTQTRLKEYYDMHEGENLRTYKFRKLTTRFEKTPQGFAEVLYPKDIFDLIDFSLRLCILREEKLRVCKNCGRYFAIGKSMKSEYCNNFPDEKGRTCRNTGAVTAWTKKRENDDVFKNYRREYKKRFARIKAGTLLQDDFYKWSEQARQKKDECESGVITPGEFAAWLAKS